MDPSCLSAHPSGGWDAGSHLGARKPLLPSLSSRSPREEQREDQALWCRAVSSQAMPCYGTAANGFSLPFATSGFSLSQTHMGLVMAEWHCLPCSSHHNPPYSANATLGHFHLNPNPHILGRNGFCPCNSRTNFPPALQAENSFGYRAETVVSPQHRQLHLAEHVFP